MSLSRFLAQKLTGIAAGSFILAMASLNPAAAQMLDGYYTARMNNGQQVMLNLHRLPGGMLSGEIATMGTRFQLQGRQQTDLLVGELSNDSANMAFEMTVEGDDLYLNIYGISPNGQINYLDHSQLFFEKRGIGQGIEDAQNLDNPEETGPATNHPVNPAGWQGQAGREPQLQGSGIAHPANRPQMQPVGRFVGGGVTLTIDAPLEKGTSGKNATYKGMAGFNGADYPVTFQGKNGRYHGYLSAGQEEIPVELLQNAKGLVLTTPQQDILLERAAAARATAQPVEQKPVSRLTRHQDLPAPEVGANEPAITNEPKLALHDGSLAARVWSGMLAGQTLLAPQLQVNNRHLRRGRAGPIDLCADGIFRTAEGVSGTWQALQRDGRSGIRLKFQDRRAEWFEMRQSGGGVFANGEEVQLAPTQNCS